VVCTEDYEQSEQYRKVRDVAPSGSYELMGHQILNTFGINFFLCSHLFLSHCSANRRIRQAVKTEFQFALLRHFPDDFIDIRRISSDKLDVDEVVCLGRTTLTNSVSERVARRELRFDSNPLSLCSVGIKTKTQRKYNMSAPNSIIVQTPASQRWL
jgi:hypothetical protein